MPYENATQEAQCSAKKCLMNNRSIAKGSRVFRNKNMGALSHDTCAAEEYKNRKVHADQSQQGVADQAGSGGSTGRLASEPVIDAVIEDRLRRMKAIVDRVFSNQPDLDYSLYANLVAELCHEEYGITSIRQIQKRGM